MNRRHAVVTGAASGIGAAIAQSLAEGGWDVTGVDQQGPRLRAHLDQISAATGTRVHAIVADLADPSAAPGAIEEAWAIAPVDGLVNAAAIYPAIPFFELDPVAWNRVQAINVVAPVFATQALAAFAVEAGTTPAVVNIASGAASSARPGTAHYSTSKAALVMATKATAIELGVHGIRVNAIAPGFFSVDSDVNPVTNEYRELLSHTVLPGPAKPADVGSVARFFLSPEAAWVTGATIPVDGGSSAGTNTLPQHWTGLTAGQGSAEPEEQPR